MLTEEEATAKVCPFVRGPVSPPHCYASGCMAWRWADGPEDDVDGDPHLDGRLCKAMGYCGLAGKPD